MPAPTRIIMKGIRAMIALEESQELFRAIQRGSRINIPEEFCGCDHPAHFDDEVSMTPKGNYGHLNWLKFYTTCLFTVKKDGIVKRVCERCRDDCCADHEKVA